jgi:hypothetical protein
LLQARAVCDNVAAICDHLQQQQQQQQQQSGSATVLQVIPPTHPPPPSSSITLGSHYVVDATGSFWRSTRYIEGSVTLDVITSPALATAVAAAFGHFSSCMRSFNGVLADTIPHFHHTPRRVRAWELALLNCPLPQRRSDAQVQPPPQLASQS